MPGLQHKTGRQGDSAFHHRSYRCRTVYAAASPSRCGMPLDAVSAEQGKLLSENAHFALMGMAICDASIAAAETATL